MNDALQNICDLSKILKSSSGESLSETSGGGDPAVVAKNWRDLVARHLQMPKNSTVLDYGCGIGRLAIGLLEDRNDLKYFGIDVVPEFIEFAKKYITKINENFIFFLVDDANEYYEKYTIKDKTKSDYTRFDFLECKPDFIFALSLFSHLNIVEAQKVLKNITSCMHDDSVVFLTTFIIDIEAKNSMRSSETFPFNPNSTHYYESYVEDDYNGPQSAIGFERSTLEDLFLTYNLVITQQISGYWRGHSYANNKSLQDILILRKRKQIPDDFDEDLYLDRHEDVKNSGMSPKFHWLSFGFHEGRQLK